MNKLKLAAYFAFLVIAGTIISSCQQDSVFQHQKIFTKTGVPMNGSQNVPYNTSLATGSLDFTYNKATHFLSYTIRWQGLSGPPFNVSLTQAPAIGLYGLAGFGFFAVPVPPLANFPFGVAQAITSGYPAAATGSYNGTVLVDNVVIKETDLLNGEFYVMIRTAAYPYGQIRGQIDFR
jgi:hypothetical protein